MFVSFSCDLGVVWFGLVLALMLGVDVGVDVAHLLVI